MGECILLRSTMNKYGKKDCCTYSLLLSYEQRIVVLIQLSLFSINYKLWRRMREWAYSSTISALGTRWRCVQLHAPAIFLPERERERDRYPLDKRRRPQNRPGAGEKRNMSCLCRKSNPGPSVPWPRRSYGWIVELWNEFRNRNGLKRDVLSPVKFNLDYWDENQKGRVIELISRS
jgi:hypothetical protein